MYGCSDVLDGMAAGLPPLEGALSSLRLSRVDIWSIDAVEHWRYTVSRTGGSSNATRFVVRMSSDVLW